MSPYLILGTDAPQMTLTQNSVCPGNESESFGQPTDNMLKKQLGLRRSFLLSHYCGFEIFGRVIWKKEPAIEPHFIEHPTQTGYFLAGYFTVTASLKELKAFLKSFCGTEFSNPEAQLRHFKENPYNLWLGIQDISPNWYFPQGQLSAWFSDIFGVVYHYFLL